MKQNCFALCAAQVGFTLLLILRLRSPPHLETFLALRAIQIDTTPVKCKLMRTRKIHWELVPIPTPNTPSATPSRPYVEFILGGVTHSE